MRKFNDKFFGELFLEKLEEKVKTSEHPIIVNISKLSLDCCRELRYLMMANRKNITAILNNWWDSLPEAKDKRFVKRLFRMDCTQSHTMGISFTGIRTPDAFFGTAYKGLLMFWR